MHRIGLGRLVWAGIFEIIGGIDISAMSTAIGVGLGGFVITGLVGGGITSLFIV